MMRRLCSCFVRSRITEPDPAELGASDPPWAPQSQPGRLADSQFLGLRKMVAEMMVEVVPQEWDRRQWLRLPPRLQLWTGPTRNELFEFFA